MVFFCFNLPFEYRDLCTSFEYQLIYAEKNLTVASYSSLVVVFLSQDFLLCQKYLAVPLILIRLVIELALFQQKQLNGYRLYIETSV